MSILQIKKEIKELKKSASIEQKNADAERLKSLTDEELQEAINQDLFFLGFNTQAEFNEAVKKFVSEKDPQTNIENDYAIEKRFFELIEDFKIFEEFVQKFSSLELDE